MNFTFGQSNIVPDFHCNDATSGIDVCTANVTKSDTGTYVGSHSYTITAKDNARNTAAKTITYGVSE